MHVGETKQKRPEFKCSKCGACCKSIAGFAEYKELDRGDGVCIHFNEKTHLCEVYDKRPDLCRVDKVYEEMFKDDMTYEEYLEINYKACKDLRAVLKIPEPGQLS